MNKAITEIGIYAELNSLYCSSYGGGVMHSSCSKIIDKIMQNISIFTNYNTLLYNFILGLAKGYYSSCSSTVIAKQCFETILNLVDVNSFTIEQFKKIANSSIYLVDIFYKKVNSVNEFSSDLVTKILYSNNTHLIDEMINSNKLIHFIPDHYEIICINSKTYSKNAGNVAYGYNNQLLTENNESISTTYNSKLVLELINRKIKVPQKAIICAIMFSINSDIIKQLIPMGPELCQEYLVAACYGNNKVMMEFLLDNKLVPNNQCIPALFTRELPKTFIDIARYNKFTVNKIIPDNIKNTHSIKAISDLVNIILKYNYNLEYNDILVLTKNFIQINQIERYNIKFDSKFLEICSEAGFYPTYNHGTTPDIKCLQKECSKSGNITAIKELIKKHKFKPDNICMQNACRLKSNLPVIRYLSEHGAPIDEFAVKNIIYATGNSASCFVVDNYLKYLENKNKAIEKVPEVNKTDKVICEDNITEPIEQEEIKLKPIEQDDALSDEEKPKKKKIIIKKTKKAKETDDVEEIKVNQNKEDYTLVPTKITDKDTVIVSNIFSNYFKLEDNKLSILSFKKILINHLNNNKLIKKGSFNIELPEDIVNAIGFDKKYGNIIDIKNLDKFCTFILDSYASSTSNSPKKN
jgi:hypothetical protein